MNSVHPTAVIADDVVLGSDNVIGAYAVILGPTTIGNRNWIGPHVVLGTPAEIRGIDHGLAGGGVGTGIRIGNANVIREYTTIHQGHYATTVVGNGCYLMNK
ncbi:MAG TPA: UDP-N-acetylglucosamine acyltransferase, partial [Jatrophihabitans sp.]